MKYANITFVTAYVVLDNNYSVAGKKGIEWRIKYFKQMACLGINLCVYYDSITKPYLNELVKKYDNIRLMDFDYTNTNIFKLCCNENLVMPPIRNESKDTKEYMRLMNCKIEFVNDAILTNPFDSKYFAWVDFSMPYIFKLPGSVSKLKELTQCTFVDKFISFPGWWDNISNSKHIITYDGTGDSSDWSHYCLENEIINLEIGTRIRYGAGNNWIEREVNDINIPATNSLWGDPSPGNVKTVQIFKKDINKQTTNADTTFTIISSKINWRFAGSFFIGDKNTLTNFYNTYNTAFTDFITSKQSIIWEVNFWAWLEEYQKCDFGWYRINSYDDMLNIPNKYFLTQYNSPITNDNTTSTTPTLNAMPHPLNIVINSNNTQSVVLRKNACFIHSTTLEMHKTEILESMIAYLKTTDIFDKLDVCFINNIGIPIDQNKFASVSNKIIINNYSTNTSLFENCTMKQIISFSKMHKDYNILYLHTKGVSYSKMHHFFNNIMFWSTYMMYCLVNHSDSCLQLLMNNYDTVGCNYRGKGEDPQHYSGNFWWAKSSYLSRLDCTKFETKYDVELGLMSETPKYFNVMYLHHMYETAYKLDTIKPVIEQSFLNVLSNPIIYYCKIGWPGLGLTNQLSNLCALIFRIIHNKSITTSIIIADNFLQDYNSANYCGISDIFDLPKMNLFLKQYKIVLVDKNCIDVRVKELSYGVRGMACIDIPNIATTKNHILTSNNLNSNYGDTCPNTVKHIFLKYTLNDIEINSIYHEDTRVNLDYCKFTGVEWFKSNTFVKELGTDKPLLDTIFQNIYFNSKFTNIADTFKQHISTDNISVLHLRNEEDAVSFWGTINRIPEPDFKTVLETKYINLIQKYIDKENHLIILTSNKNNRVVDYLRDNNYNFSFNLHTTNMRENDAILDLLISRYCTNTFIGNFNPNTYHGSTFSYLVYSRIQNKSVKNVVIDIDNINDEEYVI